MDYILHKIDQRIDLLKMTADKGSVAVHYRSRIEYMLTLMLGYLWNKNFEKLDEDEKLGVFGDIIKPTIGNVVSVCRTLDLEKEIFSKKHVAKSIDKYPSVRNEVMGHGFTFEDASEQSNTIFKDLYDSLTESPDCLLGWNSDFVYVQSVDSSICRGICYSSEGGVRPWSIPVQMATLQEGNLYLAHEEQYYILTPFIKIENAGDNIYIYGKITEKLLGQIQYNRLINTGIIVETWEPFQSLYIVNDGVKIKTSNGTIMNVYENNYTTYIDVGVRSSILKFLKDNKSSVCATLWGHGGIGKTATIQNVCDILSNDAYKVFDYILFLSAKDRRYNYYKGIVEEIQSGVSTYNNVLKTLNKIVFDAESTDEENLLNYSGRLLIVLDDFESFAKEEAKLLSDLILKLDINHHKVIVTTRSTNVALGYEIKTNELDIEQSNDFLSKFLLNERIPLSSEDQKCLKTEAIKKQVYAITGGRPLFLYQLGYLIGQYGVEKALHREINKGKSAVEFLYGRIYDYLSPKAKDLFVAMSLLVTKDDMMNVLEKAQYIIKMESDEDEFLSAVEELKKLKIIKIPDEEGRYFEVYSKEILEVMNKHFAQRDDAFMGNCNVRCAQVNKDKNADIEHSLLISANTNRLVRSEIEVVESYKQILNRPTSPLEVKANAVYNLANYLLIDRGKRPDALGIFDKYSHFFTGITYGKGNRNLYGNYALRWATTYWANGNNQEKQKAISILSDYYKGRVNYHLNQDIEIASTLLMYRSLMVLRAWRELKDENQFSDISPQEFRTRRSEQIKQCQSILTYIGNPLYVNVAKHKLEYPSGTRQSLITAFFNYVDVLVRIKKIDLAIEICDYVISYGPQNFRAQFNSKKTWLETIVSKKAY